MKDKNKISTYKVHNINNENDSFREQEKGNTLSLTIKGNGRKECKTSEVSALEQVQTSSIVSNTEGRVSSDGLNSNDGIRNLQ